MKVFFINTILVFLSFNLIAQSPVVNVYAYSRKTISGIKEGGIPGDSGAKQNRNPFPTTYYLYVTVAKGTKISSYGVWLGGKYFTANLLKVKSPVLMADNSINIYGNHKDTLVKKTHNDVYAIQLGKEQPWNNQDTVAKGLTQNNQVVIFLNCNKSPCYGSVKTTKTLTPHAAM